MPSTFSVHPVSCVPTVAVRVRFHHRFDVHWSKLPPARRSVIAIDCRLFTNCRRLQELAFDPGPHAAGVHRNLHPPQFSSASALSFYNSTSCNNICPKSDSGFEGLADGRPKVDFLESGSSCPAKGCLTSFGEESFREEDHGAGQTNRIHFELQPNGWRL